ncbi:hypothetical protein P153DRAFT_402004 [Dothidotthia symphoricarpi CBS 119687]|uniref:M protein, serotype 2.1 n=1 Tax=Dothidotthia symphoricarpi CBS 119687 TaxID=1392245 RepID=A0A6A5ZWI0_9PLEO|nr:uncharacterized protein P153DRAFT_402004 [Dothidotthia symphoricarpi CBS 119687]KAF2123395.1 hypothetical protein P153DRAFT_402004 [Dothidotthia symphoricarpi CBS 119687]
MSAATATKPPATGTTPRREATSRASAPSPAAASRTPARSSTPTATASATTSSPGGVARTRSVRTGGSGTPVSARAAVKKPAAPSALSRNTSQAEADADSQDEQAAYMQALQERLQKAETAAEERQKQLEVFSARLDEAHQEQARLEERAHEEEEKVEALENQKRELMRQQREFEGIYEAERAQSMREKEETQTREDGLQDTIQRLKETMATKNMPAGEGEEEYVSRASSFRNTPSRNNSSQHLDNAASFAPPSSIQRSNSRNNSKLINQKDKIIEDLRLELAEYQVKLLEVENAGGGRLRELEKQLLETRMTNARLMEDNESFQLLLGEKTLNGDLSRGDFLRDSSHAEDGAPAGAGPSTSLADELQSVEEADVEAVRRLEAEVNSMKDQNKALTLYINKIIGRLLTHQGFESVLGNDNDADRAPDTNKELPAPPKENDQPQGFLQRAKSVMGTSSAARKPRPTSIMGPPAVPVSAQQQQQQSANEDPTKAPSIPLGRPLSTRVPSGSYTHRRSTSEATTNMFRSPSGPASPGLTSPRNSFFGLPVNGNSETTTRSSIAPASLPGSRAVSGTVTSVVAALRADDTDAEAAGVDTPSPPRRLERSETSSTGPMTGKGMRPLRLVQNEEEAVKARKAANRGSWFGGLFGQGQGQQSQQNQQQGSPLSPVLDG